MSIHALSDAANTLLHEIRDTAYRGLFPDHQSDEYERVLNKLQQLVSALYAIKGAHASGLPVVTAPPGATELL